MNLINNNPFRILGLPVTASEREITKQVTSLSTFLEMGKSKEFDTDYYFLSPVHRTNAIIEEAKKRIEQTETKFLYSLFWFWYNNSVDELAKEFIKEGNNSKAIEILEKPIFANNEFNLIPETVYGNVLKDFGNGENEDQFHEVINSSLIFSNKTDSSYYLTREFKIDYSKNFQIECWSEWIEGVADQSYNLIWAKANGKNDFYNFGITANGYIFFDKFIDWELQNLLGWKKVDCINEKGTNKLTIKKVSNKYTFYVNDIIVHTSEFENFFGDYLGCRLRGCQKIRFFNYNISYLINEPDFQRGLISVVLKDDFINSFSSRSLEEYEIDVSNKNITLSRKTEGILYPTRLSNINLEGDFLIESCSQWVEGIDNNSFDLIWAKEDENYYGFGITANGYFTVYKYLESKYQKISGWVAAKCINKHSSNKLSLKKINSTYYFFINNEFIYSIPYEPFFGNYIGFAITGIQKVKFYDFKISRLIKDPDYAKGIKVTPKTFSNLKNLSTLYLALSKSNNKFNYEYFRRGISLAGVLFENGYMEEYCKKIGASNLIYNSEKSQQFYVNEICDSVKENLDNNNGLDTSTLIQSFAGFPSEGKQFVINKFLSKRIKFIEDEIQFAANQRKDSPDKSLKSGLKLLENTKDEILILKSSLGEADIQYGILADKLSYEIIQCAIDHFNHTKDDMPCLPLYQFGADIAISERAKERANENLISCKEWIEEKPKREAFDYIYDQLNDSVGLLSKDKQHKEFYLESAAEKLVQNTLPKLNTLKRLLGKADEEYIKISSEVVSITLAMIIAYHNSTASPNFETSISLLNTLGSFEMDEETSERLRSNKSILENNRLIRRNYASSSSSSSGSSSCYIATMVYGNSESKEVLILRKYRDEVLKRHWLGRNFIYYYYKYSPRLVTHLKNSKKINLIIKKILDFIIKIIYK